MKFILSLATILLPLTSTAAHPWTDIPGCYMTVTHNGNPANTNGAPSSIRDVDDFAVVTDIKGQPLGGLEIMIVQSHDASTDELKIDYQAVLTGRGDYTTSADGTRSFAFDGFVRFQGMPPMRVKQNASVKWLTPTQLSLKTKRVVVGTGGAYDTDDNYELDKISCPQ